jgi:hypothetical protein
MKLILLSAAVAAGWGCVPAYRGPETCTEIHFDATYVLARWAGWSPREAGAIASANALTDEHPETSSPAGEWRLLAGLVNPLTIPTVLCSVGSDLLTGESSIGRSFGRRVAEATAWGLPRLCHALHFPANGLQTPVAPAFRIDDATGEIQYGNAEGRRVLERAFMDLQVHDEDEEATLALLGIGLHSLQDSFKHAGYCAALGHLGVRPNPDEACTNVEVTLQLSTATYAALRYSRRLQTGTSPLPPAKWKEALRRLFRQSNREPEDAKARWAVFVREEFGDDYPTRDSLRDYWRRHGGMQAFERALEGAKEVLR